MLGTLVNVISIVVGSTVGSFLNKGIKESYKTTITQALGLVAVSLGITWIVTNVSSGNEPLLFIICLVLGGLIGSILKIEQRVGKLGDKLKSKLSGDNDLIQGLTTAVLLFCVGTMSILGPIDSALKGDNTLLFINAILDGVTALILASSFGIGIILSAIAVFLWQGTIFIFAHFVAPFITPEIIGQLSIIGGILIFSTGINILGIKKINTLNLLPALVILPIYYIPFIYNAVEGVKALVS